MPKLSEQIEKSFGLSNICIQILKNVSAFLRFLYSKSDKKIIFRGTRCHTKLLKIRTENFMKHNSKQIFIFYLKSYKNSLIVEYFSKTIKLSKNQPKSCNYSTKYE